MIKSFDFFFDFTSPYSYLANKQIRNIENQYKIDVNYMPILLKNITYFLAPVKHPSQEASGTTILKSIIL